MRFSLKRRKEMAAVYYKLSKNSLMIMEIAERAVLSGIHSDEEKKLAQAMQIMAKIHKRNVFRWYNRMWWY